jgi:hypothetical protein
MGMSIKERLGKYNSNSRGPLLSVSIIQIAGACGSRRGSRHLLTGDFSRFKCVRLPGRLADTELVPLDDAAADVCVAAAVALCGRPSVEGVAPREGPKMLPGGEEMETGGGSEQYLTFAAGFCYYPLSERFPREEG